MVHLRRSAPATSAIPGGTARTVAGLWGAAIATLVLAEFASMRADWWQLSLCMCGTAYSHAPWVFSVGMIVTAALVGVGAAHTWRLTSPLERTGEWTRRRRITVTAVLSVEAGLILGMAVVPYDASAAAWAFHNVMGWGQGWLLAGGIILTLLWPPPHVKMRAASTCALLGIAGSYLLFGLGLLPYSVFEILAILCLAAWSTLLFVQVDRRLSRLGTADQCATEPGRRDRALQC